jgi:hypothetical protein
MELSEGLVPVGSAVSLYRSKFTDCLAGPVRNNRRKLDRHSPRQQPNGRNAKLLADI